MSGRKMRPRLLQSGLTGRVLPAASSLYRVTTYITATTKHDVTEDFAALATPAPEPPRCEHGAIREPCVPCSEYVPPAPDRGGLRAVEDHVWRYKQGAEHLAGCCVHPDAALLSEPPLDEERLVPDVLAVAFQTVTARHDAPVLTRAIWTEVAAEYARLAGTSE